MFCRKLRFNFKCIMRVLIICLSLLCVACSRSNTVDENCQFLIDVAVNETINLSFPQFAQLEFPSNSVYLANAGNGGIIITNVGNRLVAFDAADPNRPFAPCAILEINGVIGETSCEDQNRYSLFTGAPLDNPELRCTLRPYRVEQSGSTVRIFN